MVSEHKEDNFFTQINKYGFNISFVCNNNMSQYTSL